MHQRYSNVSTKLHRVACAGNHETLLQRNALLQTCYYQMSKQPTGDALISTIRPHCIKNRDRASPGASLAEIGVGAEALPPGPAAGAGDPALGAASVCASVDPTPPVCTYHTSTRSETLPGKPHPRGAGECELAAMLTPWSHSAARGLLEGLCSCSDQRIRGGKASCQAQACLPAEVL